MIKEEKIMFCIVSFFAGCAAGYVMAALMRSAASYDREGKSDT